jgi:hypothetical protein
MATAATQINFFLSGGSGNSNPNRSIGGPPSAFPVLGSLNNLFADVTSAEAIAGKTDFRCFYVKNNSSTEYLYDIECYIDSQSSRGSSAEVGIAIVTDIQSIEIKGSVTSGNLILQYEQAQFVVNWEGSAQNFQNNLISGLASIGLEGVEVSTSLSASSQNFNITFQGNQDKRNHQKLVVSQNNLEGAISVSILKLSEGQPINSNAPLLAVETIPPAKVNFYAASQRVALGTLRPGDFVPIWIKRTTSPNTDFKENDYFVFKISGKPFAFSTSSLTWTQQPSNQPYVSGNEIEFSYSYNTSIGNTPYWQYSDDEGATWSENPTVESVNAYSSIDPGTNISYVGGNLRIKDPATYVSGRRYRVRVAMGIIGSQYQVYSNSATVSASCIFIECGGSAIYADCGLINDPGYSYALDCEICECVKSPVTPTSTPTLTATPAVSVTPTSTPTLTVNSECHFIECGGSAIYADCGLINDPGYSYALDCEICECVKSPVPTSTPNP